MDGLPIQDRLDVEYLQGDSDAYWGFLWRQLDLGMGRDFEMTLLSTMASKEFATIEKVLHAAITRLSK